MHPVGRFFTGIFSAIGVLATIAAIGFLVAGISARAAPGTLEARVARAARHLLVPSHARSAANPLPATKEILSAARDHFADHCASCHGNDGKGDTLYGRRLSPRAPDLRAPSTQALSDGELFWIIENGVKLTGMPGFGDEDPSNDDESWALVSFIRTLPRLSAKDLEAMEKKNPTLSRADVESEQERNRFLAGDAPPANHDHH